MKVLFIDPAKRFLEKEYSEFVKPYPHIGLIYIATYLESKGIEVCFFDAELDEYLGNNLKTLLKSFNPDIVAITTMTYMLNDAYFYAKQIKEFDASIKIVMGGAHSSALPNEVLSNKHVDFVVIGEGEETFHNIIKYCDNSSDNIKLRNVDGIGYKEKGEIFVNPKKNYIKDLDSIPFPNWKLSKYDKYNKIYSKKFNKDVHLYQLASSRGCPFGCAFCYPLHGRRFSSRSAENVLDEVRHLVDSYGAKHLDFTDSAATVNLKRFNKICNGLIQSGLNNEISWSIETRVDLVNRELFKNIKKAGGIFVYFGVESGDDYILDKMNKGINVQQIKQAIKMAYDEGLYVKTSFIIGHAFETQKSAMRTFELAIELRETYGIDLYFNLIDVYPGTNFYEYVNSGYGGLRWVNGIKDNWSSLSRSHACIEVNDLTKDIMEKTVDEYNRKINLIKPKKLYNFT